MYRKPTDEVRNTLRAHHYCYRTEESHMRWIRRDILCHGTRHPRDLGAQEIQAPLDDLAVRGRVAASTQNQALSALLLRYKKVLNVNLPFLDEIVRAQGPVREPVVMTQDEVPRVLVAMSSTHWLMANLLYGSGLRLTECLRLRQCMDHRDIYSLHQARRLRFPEPAGHTLTDS